MVVDGGPAVEEESLGDEIDREIESLNPRPQAPEEPDLRELGLENLY